MLPEQLLQSSDAARVAATAAAKRAADRARRELRETVRKNSLAARHSKLEYEILVERQRPLPDTARLSALKLEKLYIKEELEALKNGSLTPGTPSAAAGPSA